MDQSADAAVASSALKITKFFGYPFRIVLAMRPQRERQAAKIAEEFHSQRHVGHRDCLSPCEAHPEDGPVTAASLKEDVHVQRHTYEAVSFGPIETAGLGGTSNHS
jgi:hypothetical protein